jgi:chorismate mutase
MKKPEERLQELRGYIDQADELIAQLLIARSEVVGQVAVLKAANWPKNCHIRSGREGQMHRWVAQRFAGTAASPRMTLAMWRQLIGGSTHIESPLNITYLSNYPEHRFLAREYFGVQVNSKKASTLLDAVDSIHRNESNIVVLPHPESASWWQNIGSYSGSGLRIFALLPVDTASLPTDCTPAVALAAITPENSGDDVSYFVTLDGGLEIVDGFHTQRDGAIFIGAHPRPITV